MTNSQSPDRAALAKIVSIALAGQSPLPHHLVCKCTVCEMRRIAEDALARSPSPYSGAAREAIDAAILAFGNSRLGNHSMVLTIAGKPTKLARAFSDAIISALTTLPRDAERETIEAAILVAAAVEQSSEQTDWFEPLSKLLIAVRALPSIPSREGQS